MTEHSPSVSNEIDSDIGSAGHTGSRLFPSDELLQFQQQMGILRSSNYALHPLVACMAAAWSIMRQTDRIRQTDMDCVRRFLREDLQPGMDKLLVIGSSSRAYIDDEAAFEALQLLVMLAAAMLEYRQQQSPDVLPELDSDMSPLMSVILAAFNNHKPLHLRYESTMLPGQVVAKYAMDGQDDVQWVQPRMDDAANMQLQDEDLDDMLDEVQEKFQWWAHIIQTFGNLRGFEIIIEMLSDPAAVSFNLLNTSLAVLAQVVDDATPEAKEQFRRVIEPVSAHVLQLVEADSDRLADHGNDRTYTIFQCLANINLPRVITFGCSQEEALPLRRQLQHIVCTFVSKMLDSSSFNKLLSGARECNKVLSAAVKTQNSTDDEALLQEMCTWLHDSQIVQRLLRTGLHHKQYMNEVKGVMTTLTRCAQLTAEHLDLMWAVTEKEDAYDAVKTHMYDLLAAVARECQPSQLDMLFAKLERRQFRNLQDMERVLSLLESLAESDSEDKMYDKIVQLVWDLTMPADAPPQLLETLTLVSVVKCYLRDAKPQEIARTCFQLTQKCFNAVKAGEGGQVPLLRTARELLKLLPADSKSKTMLTRGRAVDDLNNALDVTKSLVEAICSRVTSLQSKIAAAAAAAGGMSQLEAADMAAIKAASMAELEEGSWSYTDIIKELVTALKFLAVTASGYFDQALAEQLWDTLMVNAPSGEDQLPATHVFFRAAFMDINAHTAFLEEPTRRLLLEQHLVKQDVETLSLPTAKLTCDVFAEVNREAHAVRSLNLRKAASDAVLVDLDKVTGLDLLWRIYLCNKDECVASTLRGNLLTLYHSLLVFDDSHTFRRALVEELVSHMRAVVDKLGGSGAEAELAARTVARCLAMANAAVQPADGLVEATMPPVPAHNRAWRGTPIVLEIQREGAARQRLTSHVNEYVGLLRERLARSMGCSAKNVRMFSMGQELNMDSNTVAESSLHNRAALNVMESPEPNKFTRAPSEYRQEYEMNSFAWMFSQADGVYPLLLRFIDTPFEAQGIASMALQLLAVLPTYPSLSERLAAALDGPDKQQQLAGMLDSSSNNMLMDAEDKQQQQQCAPYQTLYSLQALCALLFPTFDEALLASADREAAAEGSACPSPAAAPAQGATTPPGNSAQPTADAPVNAADAAAASALQHQHHREVQQQEFLHSKGLEVVLEAAHKAAMTSSADLQLRRQLSELLVVLLHNLLDAAQAWQTVPWAAAAPGNSLGPSTMSGAESGAGQPAGTARHAAPASSLVGASGVANAAVESASMPMAGVQQAADPAGSSAALGDSHDGVQQPCSKVAATTSDTACHHPSSPAMEVSSPLPGQQQQSGKQRQRGGDLPPLPPQAQQQQQLAGGIAGAGGPGIAALFSSQTLQLIADTLLGVAVDTSQLWGCDAAAAAEALADEDGSSKDVAVAREALQLLLRVLEQHPPLLQPLLLDVEQPPLVCTVLLSPYYAALRHQAADLLEKLVNNDSNRQRLLPWLLIQLAATRPLVQQRPASCGHFYTLLSSMLMKLGQCWGMLPGQLFAVANSMLDEEVAALQTIAAAGPAPSPHTPSKQQHQQRRRRRRQQQLASPEDASATDEQQAEPGACSLLQGRLQLILALVRVLDRRAVGSEGQGALMKLLLHEFLFPEAVQRMAAAAGQLDLQRCVSSLEPHCATPSCRKAALELLAELMGDAPSSLEEGVNMLLALHYQEQVLRNYGMVPRMLRRPGQYAGLRNGGATCYMNAVFQQLFMQPGIRGRILGSDEVPVAEKDSSVFAQLQGLFAQLALTKSTFAQPYRFWAAFKDYDGTPIDVREHQDAYEFFTRLQDFVDQHLISTGQEPAIRPMMGGAFVQQIICRGHDFTSERNEDFYQISVEVKGMGTLEKSLDDYVKGELMEGDNAYLCEELGKRVPAVKRTAIRTLPQMLCIHLKRFEFDYHNQTRHKLRDRFEFPFELDMFPYTAEGLEAADQQQKAAEGQQQDGQPGQQQQQRTLRPSSSSGAAVAGPSNPAYMYDLHGVVVHSGSAFTGHYYSYIKERTGSSSAEQGPQWFCFDDKDVSPWDESNLEVDCFGGKASQDFDARGFRPQRNEYERAHSAYMLFYERRAAPADGSTDVATSNNNQQQQQTLLQSQQQPAAGAAADVDVEMETGDGPQPAAANASSSQQQQELQQPGFSIPYGMPESLFREIVEQNIFLIWNTHVLDKDYFRFVRQLVDSRGDLGQLTTRKSRRRDGAAAGAGLNPAVLASGSSDRVHSSMVCDTSTPQQPQPHQPCPSTGSGALPMQVSPTPTPTPAPSAAPPGAAASSAAVPGPLDVPGNGPPPAAAADMQQSPGPSSRRGEEAEAVAQALMRLGVLFQFEVYLHAADALRSESNVWTEALRSLMGSGSSSTACMQVFLELVQMHPNWLRSYLVECSSTGQNCPRRWASDMLAWTLTAASKRCAPQLQVYVSICLQARLIVYQGSTGAVLPQQLLLLEQQLRLQHLPPLGQALVGVVQQLVLLVQNCLPQVDQMGQMVSDPDIPSEPARVLLAYAESSPWAAAHLLEVLNVVPVLEQHINIALNPEPEDDFTHEELVPVYELLDELVSFASNLPQLTAELNGKPAVTHNAYIRYLPGSNGASSSGSGNSAGSADAAAGPSALHCTLSPSSYRKLMGKHVLEGMVNNFVCMSPRVVHLAGLLSFNNEEAIRALVNAASHDLFYTLRRNQPDAPNEAWEVTCRNLGLMQLQPDDFVEKRVHFWAYGAWHNMDAQHQPSNTHGVLSYPGAITFAALYAWQVLRAVVRYYREQQNPQAQRILQKMGKLVRLYHQRMLGDLLLMIQFLRRQPEQAPAAYLPMLEETHDLLNWLSQQGQQQQQQHLAAAQQQQQEQEQLQEADEDAAAEGSP